MCVSYDLNMEHPWLMVQLSWAWGALPFLCMFSIQTEQFVSTRVAAKKKMNCMYSSNSRHLILACLAAIQLVVSTKVHVGAHHFQKSLRVFACWLQSKGSMRIEPDPPPMLSPAGRVLPSAILHLTPHKAPPQHCSGLRSAGTQQLPQPFLGHSMWDVLHEHGKVPVHSVFLCLSLA